MDKIVKGLKVIFKKLFGDNVQYVILRKQKYDRVEINYAEIPHYEYYEITFPETEELTIRFNNDDSICISTISNLIKVKVGINEK